MRKALERALRGEAVPVNAEHRAALEQELLAGFDRRTAAPAPRRLRWPGYAAGALTAVLLTASQAPAEVLVEVGKRITVELGADAPVDDGLRDALAETFRAGPSEAPLEVNVNLRAYPDRTRRMTVDAWGERLGGDAEIEARVRALPGLASARVQVTTLRGRVRGTVLSKVSHLLRRRATPEERERARVQVIEVLRREEGGDARIDVEVLGDDAGSRVRVKVKRRGPDP